MPEPASKREWPDGDERRIDGTLVVFGKQGHGPKVLPANELPREIYTQMNESDPDTMLELHHHADPEITIYIRNKEIIALDARWAKLEEN